uniref:Gamma-tubulin complex component n=1 Tax=Rhizophora mucronata TaxID=61149 RepID=A0A2P2LNQ6_RHIMU
MTEILFILCRNHLNFRRDHLSVLLTLFGLLQLVIFGSLW